MHWWPWKAPFSAPLQHAIEMAFAIIVTCLAVVTLRDVAQIIGVPKQLHNINSYRHFLIISFNIPFIALNIALACLKCYSFIPDISIAPLKVHYYLEALQTTALILCWSSHTEVLQATVTEGLAKVSTRWLELDSNLRSYQ